MQKETESTVAAENHADQESEISYPLNTDDTLTLWSTNQIKLSQAFADYTICIGAQEALSGMINIR